MLPSAIRRLAADLTSLHETLPPNYLFSPEHETQDDLSSLDILLVGPSHTPFCDGIWRLHFDIPADYPQQPPTANFRTPIFHPNVDSQTGSICVETLKRDWNNALTLRDLLITISCLLIQPNPDSALNAEAGALIQEGYEHFAKRARLMTSIHANVPSSLLEAAREAQARGEDNRVGGQGRRRSTESSNGQRMRIHRAAESPQLRAGRQNTAYSADATATATPLEENTGGRHEKRKRSHTRTRSDGEKEMADIVPSSSDERLGLARSHTQEEPGSTMQKSLTQHRRTSPDLMPARRRRPVIRSRLATRRSNGSPIANLTRRRLAARSNDALITPNDSDVSIEDSMQDDQENGPAQKQLAHTADYPAGSTPRRPPGPPTPLGELTFEDESSADLMEMEYPPSPKKSPVKHAEPIRRLEWSGINDTTAGPYCDVQTPTIFSDHITPAPTSLAFGKGKARCHAAPAAPLTDHGIAGEHHVSHDEHSDVLSIDHQLSREEQASSEERWSDERLWELCGGNIKRWNRGDFDSQPFCSIASRW